MIGRQRMMTFPKYRLCLAWDMRGFRLATWMMLALSYGALAQPTTAVTLPNGWSLSPAGRSIPLGDLPLQMAVSPDRRRIAVTNNGQSVQSIQLIDVQAEKVIHSRIVDKAWYGLAFSPDGRTLYASGGHDNRILEFDISHDSLRALSGITLGEPWPNRIAPDGLAVDRSGRRLYAVTRDDKSLYQIDLRTRNVTSRTPLGSEAYACILSPDGRSLYISLWGGDSVLKRDLATGRSVAWPTGDNPNELCLSRNGRILYVANANDNSVSVIDARTGRTLEVLNTAPYPDAPPGSTTNSLCLSGDGRTLYVANADNHCLAVFDVSLPGRSRPMGFIPVGWYPTSVRTVGDRIFTANGKGFSSFANPFGPNPVDTNEKAPYQQGDAGKPKSSTSEASSKAR